MVPQHYTEELLKTFLWQKKKQALDFFHLTFIFSLSLCLSLTQSFYLSIFINLSVYQSMYLPFIWGQFLLKKDDKWMQWKPGITISNLILAVTFYIWIKLLFLLKRETTNLLFYQIQQFWNAIKSCHILWIICEIF